MNSPEIKLAVVSNVWCKQMHFANAGDSMEGHTHTHDHLTLLAWGELEVLVDGDSQTFTAPHMIFIKKDKVHHLRAKRQGTVAYCIQGLRDANEDIIDGSMVPEAVKQEALARLASPPK